MFILHAQNKEQKRIKSRLISFFTVKQKNLQSRNMLLSKLVS